jgi:hypothetical protein
MGTFDPMRVLKEGDFFQLNEGDQQAALDLYIRNGDLPPNTTVEDLLGQFATGPERVQTDEQGKVTNASTAQVDKYGGRFRYAGETRWQRDASGKIIRQVLGKDNRWHKVKNRRRKGKGKGKERPGGNPNQGEKKAPLQTIGLVNFNAGAG